MPSGLPTPRQIEFFWRHVDKSGECWEWTGTRARDGYGTFGPAPAQRGLRHAHRVSWAIHNGPIPDGLCVLHRCDNRPCVNPAHLWLGTDADNVADMMAKGRHRSGNGRHIHTTLSEQDVRTMRALWAAGVTQRDLARRYGIASSTAYRVVRRVNWAHVE